MGQLAVRPWSKQTLKLVSFFTHQGGPGQKQGGPGQKAVVSGKIEGANLGSSDAQRATLGSCLVELLEEGPSASRRRGRQDPNFLYLAQRQSQGATEATTP